MARAEDYRRYGAECRALAERAVDPNDRARLLKMAEAFDKLAGEGRTFERNPADKK